ncbi:hypothetical protein ACG7TL_008575 [Trametes sanguinea]
MFFYGCAGNLMRSKYPSIRHIRLRTFASVRQRSPSSSPTVRSPAIKTSLEMSQAAVQPTPQGVNSTTFKAPSLNHGLSLAGLYKYHAKNSPNHAAWAYAEPDTRVLRDITYAEAWDKIERVATTVSRNMTSLPAQQSQEFGKKRPVIGVLALSDTLSYMYLIIAIISLGYTAFPLSPRNSAAVTAHLLESTGVVQLYASKDAGMQTLAREAIEILAKKGISVETIPMITPEDHESAISALPAADVPVHIEDDDVTIILHSSGQIFMAERSLSSMPYIVVRTTAFPKPIPITKLGLINLTKIPFPTPANFLDAWVACKCNIVFCVPVFIEAWARDPANLPKLQALDCIPTFPRQVYCGASVNKGIGDMLASSGVTLHPFWGRKVSYVMATTPRPATMLIPRDPPPAHEWDYFKISNHLTLHMEPQDGLENIYEPIHIPTDICFPQVTNAERDGKPVFAVGDLLERHPTDPKRWKVFGRKDDQIMLSTGENGMLVHDPRIASALMFGRSRIEPGVLIEPANGIHINPEDKQQLEEYIDSIWYVRVHTSPEQRANGVDDRPTVEKVNTRFPAYANIKRNMIVVTSPKKPLEYTPKGTPRRGVCLKLYGDEIEDLYTRVTDAFPENREFPDRM